MAVPTVLSQVITLIYNVADAFFIGRTNDPLMVAAVTLSYTLFFLFTAIANLFGTGGGSLISRLLGERREDEAARVSSYSFFGTIIGVLLYSLCVYVFMTPLLYIMGSTDNTIFYARQYTLWVIVIGGLPSCLAMTLAHLLRSIGYSRQAGFGLSMGAALNIFLDPLFMFVLLPRGNEVLGAAFATLLSNFISAVYLLFVTVRLRSSTVLRITPQPLPEKSSVRAIYTVGLPAAAGSILYAAAITLTNKLISTYGDTALAAYGIVKKIDMLPNNVGMGLAQAMVPLVAYNFASGNYKRMRSFIRAARISGIAFSLFCVTACELLPGALLRFFIQDADTIRLGASFLRFAVTATPFIIINFQMAFTFQAMGMGGRSLLLTVFRQGVIQIPILFLMNHLFGLLGVIATQTVSEGLTVIVSVLLYRMLRIGKDPVPAE